MIHIRNVHCSNLSSSFYGCLYVSVLTSKWQDAAFECNMTVAFCIQSRVYLQLSHCMSFNPSH